MDKITMDVGNLNHIPEDKRDSATSYESIVSLYTESDKKYNLIPEGKEVGDVHLPSTTRWTVTFTE